MKAHIYLSWRWQFKRWGPMYLLDNWWWDLVRDCGGVLRLQKLTAPELHVQAQWSWIYLAIHLPAVSNEKTQSFVIACTDADKAIPCLRRERHGITTIWDAQVLQERVLIEWGALQISHFKAWGVDCWGSLYQSRYWSSKQIRQRLSQSQAELQRRAGVSVAK